MMSRDGEVEMTFQTLLVGLNMVIAYTMVCLNKWLFTVRRVLYSGGLVLEKI